jgi:hypothetical protein
MGQRPKAGVVILGARAVVVQPSNLIIDDDDLEAVAYLLVPIIGVRRSPNVFQVDELGQNLIESPSLRCHTGDTENIGLAAVDQVQESTYIRAILNAAGLVSHRQI